MNLALKQIGIIEIGTECLATSLYGLHPSYQTKPTKQVSVLVVRYCPRTTAFNILLGFLKTKCW